MGQGFGIAVICGIGCRCGSDPALLWLWCKPEAVTSIRPLAWELPYAAGVALKKKKVSYQNKEGKTTKSVGFQHRAAKSKL